MSDHRKNKGLEQLDLREKGRDLFLLLETKRRQIARRDRHIV